MKAVTIKKNKAAAAGAHTPLRAAAAAMLMALLLLASALLSGCSALGQGTGSLFNNPRKEFYNKGVEAYNNNDFYTARDYFRTAEGYANSKSYLEAIDEYERLYLEAVDLLEAKDYTNAMKTFEAISGFGNASEYIDYINKLKAFYEEGMSLYAAQDYLGARERFVQAVGYGSSDAYIKSIDDMEELYQTAMGYYNEHKYRTAIAAFEAIGVNYRDTYDMISACYGELEHGGITITNYLAAYKKSHEDAGNSIRFDLTDINETGFMVSDSMGVLFIGNTDSFGVITTVSFWIDDKMVEEIGKEEVNGILAHCIRALDIDMMSYADVLENMDSYTSGWATYANFTFDLSFDGSGHTVLTAMFINS